MFHHSVIFRTVLLFVLISFVTSASILDLLYWEQDEFAAQQRNENPDDSAPKSCICDGPSCMCCVDFNLTYIDLGGPGCVRMKYISQEEGIAVNVSYGESLLHSEEVKGPHPEPTCMGLLTNLAQVCALFSELSPHNDGLRGCLLLEPKLLGEVTASFNIGCFTMGPAGMRLENSTLTTPTPPTPAYQNQTSSEIDEDELIAAVNESAQQGIAFFSNLLGLNFGKPETNEPVTSTGNNNATVNATSTAVQETSR